ncbi:response regulator transcription factor [Jatrophihabitans sp. YIM 134969]
MIHGHPSASPAGGSQRLAWELYGARGPEELLVRTAIVLGQLLPSDQVSWNAVDVGTHTAAAYAPSGTPDFGDHTVRALAAVAADHPMVRSYLDAPPSERAEPRRLSDVTTRRQLRGTRAYAELLHPSGAEHQLTILTARAATQSGRCWTFNRRTSDYRDEERDLAQALQPLLAAVEIACDALTAAPIEDSWSTEGRVSLTRREQEVLGCVARGLTASAVARVLGISERTVRKHLEHCYAKLDCHDRLVAVDRARRWGLLGVDLHGT